MLKKIWGTLFLLLLITHLQAQILPKKPNGENNPPCKTCVKKCSHCQTKSCPRCSKPQPPVQSPPPPSNRYDHNQNDFQNNQQSQNPNSDQYDRNSQSARNSQNPNSDQYDRNSQSARNSQNPNSDQYDRNSQSARNSQNPNSDQYDRNSQSARNSQNPESNQDSNQNTKNNQSQDSNIYYQNYYQPPTSSSSSNTTEKNDSNSPGVKKSKRTNNTQSLHLSYNTKIEATIFLGNRFYHGLLYINKLNLNIMANSNGYTVFKHLDLNNIKKIFIKTWQAIPSRYDRRTFQFIPTSYVIQAKDGKLFKYYDNIETLNAFIFKTGKGKSVFYSYFVDYNEDGEWVNLGTSANEKKVSNPIKGVVTEIDFSPLSDNTQEFNFPSGAPSSAVNHNRDKPY